HIRTALRHPRTIDACGRNDVSFAQEERGRRFETGARAHFPKHLILPSTVATNNFPRATTMPSQTGGLSSSALPDCSPVSTFINQSVAPFSGITDKVEYSDLVQLETHDRSSGGVLPR